MLVGMAEKARPLGADQKVLVLVDDVQLGGEDREEGVVLPGSVEELVVDIELQQVARLEPVVPLGAFAVDLHPLEPDVLLGQGGGEEGQGLAQPAVKPLSGVVFSHGELSHGLSSSPIGEHSTISEEKFEESI